MPEEKKYNFCWSKCQWMDRKVCESRIQRGKCRVLDRPKNPIPEIRAIFHKEKGEIQIECEEIR